ncbi:LacI family transcriptional regulator [Pacificibacter maritimus]|uniref:LacI family transcriptional regulator n=1 Tax=Pacificibacter maritimus TaxID=762213 RepID=A0A3N4VFL1_9RHOB|nr:substrate-binding domain-containing protein [Pacificibacter maritimus]RPE71714.1 LacI family transcriptional regulator [Pacificibacter maritimus]
MNLKELSKILNLSQTTVSRALNGYPEVSEATRNRVNAAARKYHYIPNTRAQGLATGRTHAVGHVIPMSTKHEVVNPVFTDFVAGASEVYSRENYDMHLTIVPDTGEEHAYRKIAAKGSVDGVIVHGPVKNDPRINLLKTIGMPFVVHGRSKGDDSNDYTWVDMNNIRAFERATQFLIDLGHKRIALLNGLIGMDFADRRLTGHLKALKANGIPEDKALCFSDEMTEDYGYVATMTAMQQGNPPTAFLASSIIVGIGIRRACSELGLTFGKEVSLIVHDDELSYFRNGTTEPIYTATRSSVRQAGHICAQLLMDQIADPTLPPRHVLLEAELIIGNTTGPAPQTPNAPKPS